MSFVRSARALVAVGALVQGIAPAQAGIEVRAPAGSLDLPVSAGQNRIVDVLVYGAVKGVWLARDKTAKERVALAPAGPGRYQVNLADPAVERLLTNLPAERRSAPTFVICAETAGGEVLASVPVRYRLVRRGAGPPELHLVPKEGTPSVVPMSGPWTRRWVTVSELARLAIATGERPLETLPVAATGSHTWKFAPDGQRLCTLPLAPDLRQAWADEGVLQVVLHPGAEERRAVFLHARPEELELAADPTEFTIVQRRRARVPGSRHYLSLSIGDITRGQVLVQMRNAEGGTVIERQSMRQGDEVRFQLGQQEYVLTLRKLVNFLIGDDHAVFAVGTKSLDAERRIAAVLDAMAASGMTFVRNGVEYDGPSAARFLRQKYALRARPVRTFQEFVGDIASRSSTTGRPYLVRDAGGDRPLAEWLFARDKELQAESEKTRQPRPVRK